MRSRSGGRQIAALWFMRPSSQSTLRSQVLAALFQAGSLAFQRAQIVELGAADAAGAHDIDVIDHLGVHREDALHALAETDFADGDAFPHAHAVAGNQYAFKSLEAFFFTFLDF